MTATFTSDNSNRLSVVMRFHNRQRLPLLEEAVFSLCMQDWRDLEVLVAIQNGCDELVTAVREIVDSQPWAAAPNVQLFPVEVGVGVDGRCRLLNTGIARATGRYLAFLDDDDVIYGHAYTTLISRLRQTEAALAVGGSRVTKLRKAASHWFVVAKERPFAWGRTRYDLFKDNFVPIHSYVVDRSRVKAEDLHFDESLTLLEDYDLLLRLATAYEFDFGAIDTLVCESRWWLDGSNSFPIGGDGLLKSNPAVEQARAEMRKRKQKLFSAIPKSEQSRLQSRLQSRDPWQNMDHFIFKAARRIYVWLGRHPRLERGLEGAAQGSWSLYKRAKGRY